MMMKWRGWALATGALAFSATPMAAPPSATVIGAIVGGGPVIVDPAIGQKIDLGAVREDLVQQLPALGIDRVSVARHQILDGHAVGTRLHVLLISHLQFLLTWHV